MKIIETDVCVIGAGAGGTGCVYRLIKNGIKTVVVDKNSDFGGTAVFSGVDGWEPGVTLDGIHSLLKDDLQSQSDACQIIEIVPNCNLFNPDNDYNWENHSDDYPWGLSLPTGKTYEDTLKRCRFLRGDSSLKRFQFEPEAMSRAINNVLSDYKSNLTEYFGYTFTDCTTDCGKINTVTISNGEEEVKIVAKYFVDASGDIVLARKAGCAHAFGTEDSSAYGEPSAPQKSENVNAVTYVFRVSPTDDKNHIDEIPEEYRDVDIRSWKETRMKSVISCFSLNANGEISINMLPTMEGGEYFALGEKADLIGHARVYAYWEYLQKEKNMQGYKLKCIYDAGIRESYRLIGKYVLRETDIRQGLKKQPKVGKTIAIADHALDVHGDDGMCRELELPYEIPLECTMTNEYDNLFVACRGASFSHIALATVRLTRTMLSLGEGVGEYISELLTK